MVFVLLQILSYSWPVPWNQVLSHLQVNNHHLSHYQPPLIITNNHLPNLPEWLYCSARQSVKRSFIICSYPLFLDDSFIVVLIMVRIRLYWRYLHHFHYLSLQAYPIYHLIISPHFIYPLSTDFGSFWLLTIWQTHFLLASHCNLS